MRGSNAGTGRSAGLRRSRHVQIADPHRAHVTAIKLTRDEHVVPCAQLGGTADARRVAEAEQPPGEDPARFTVTEYDPVDGQSRAWLPVNADTAAVRAWHESASRLLAVERELAGYLRKHRHGTGWAGIRAAWAESTAIRSDLPLVCRDPFHGHRLRWAVAAAFVVLKLLIADTERAAARPVAHRD